MTWTSFLSRYTSYKRISMIYLLQDQSQHANPL